MPRITDKKIIKNFLTCNGPDHLGRTLPSYWDCDNEEIERCHDRIQFMFPLHEDSRMAKNFPIVTKELLHEMESEGTLELVRKNIIKNTHFFLKFLGVIENSVADLVTEKQIFYPIRGNWCRNGDHNLLRITRMFRSLRLFGLEDLAKQIYPHFIRIAVRAGINRMTLDYWERAMNDDVWASLY